jgi:hypothetical protein
MPKPEKYFCEYRNEATDPFVQLFIMACNERLQSQSRLEQGASISQPQNNKQINHNMQNTEITQQDCEFVANRLNAINDRIFEICRLAGCLIDECSYLGVSTTGIYINVVYLYQRYTTHEPVAANFKFPIDWLLKTDAEIKNLAKAHNAEIIKERYGIADNRDNDDFPF